MRFRRSRLDERFRRLDAAESVLRFVNSDRTVKVERVGDAATITLSELDSLLRPAADLLGLPERLAQGLVDRARRLPVDDPPGVERVGSPDGKHLSVLDRVDALAYVFRAFSVPRANVLIDSAQQLLGHVVRDAKLIRKLLAELPSNAPQARRTLWVALGLLGEPVALEDVELDRAEFQDAVAWVLAAVLADWEGAVEQVRQLDQQVEGAARKATDMALARLEAGLVPSVVG